MQTIKQWLMECDREKLADAFVCQYFNIIKVYDIPLEDYTKPISELVGRLKKNVSSCVEHLISLEPLESPDGKTGIIFGYNRYGDREPAELVHIDDLIAKGIECDTFSYEFTPQAQLISYYIASNEYTKCNQYEVMASFVYEISCFGWKQEYLQEVLADLETSIQEMKEGHFEYLDFDDVLDDISERYGLGASYRESEEEEKQKLQIEMEILAFDNMCKQKALAEILKMLQEQKEYINEENSFI